MAVYPETTKPSLTYDVESEFATIMAGPYENHVAATRPARLFDVYRVRLRYDRTTWTEIYDLYEFFMDRKGRYETFAFKDFRGWDSSPVGIAWPKLYVGVGDGTTTVFDLPMVSSSSGTLYKAGVAQVGGGTDYTLALGAGTNGADRATMTTAPASGALLQWKATGRRMCQYARFMEDRMSMSNFVAMLHAGGLGIEEFRAA